LAEVRGVSLDAIAEQTTANFYRLFAKVPRAGDAKESERNATVQPNGAARLR
jgi:hypothetical protein